MPTRKDYPIPDCPKCGKRDNRVLNTYYTRDELIIRLRECNFCEHRIYTEQPGETALDPDVYRVIFPKFTVRKGAKFVQVRHKSQDTAYRERKAKLQARANGEPQPTRWNREPSYKMQPPEG